MVVRGASCPEAGSVWDRESNLGHKMLVPRRKEMGRRLTGRELGSGSLSPLDGKGLRECDLIHSASS